MQYYDFTIAQGKTQAIAAPGRYLYYYAGSAAGDDTTISVKNDNGGLNVILRPGQSIRLTESDNRPDQWFVTNYKASQPIIGSVVIGDGVLDDNTVSGSVSVVDSQRTLVQANQSFFGSKSYGAAAGNYPNIQLFNPAASGVNVFVEEVSLTFSVAPDSALIGFYAGQLSSMGGSQQTKKSGGGAAKAEVRYQDSVALATFNAAAAYTFANETVGSRTFGLKTPVMIAPGFGLVVSGKTLASAIGVGFQWLEIAQ